MGIAEYTSPTVPGIGGVLKRLHTDFRVNELAAGEKEIVLKAEEEEAEAEEDSGSGSSSSREEDEGTATTAREDHGDACSFVRFTLRKERMDTLGAIANLSKQLGVPVRSFGFAGLKDHRAVTVQEMTVRDVPAMAVAAVKHAHFRIGHVRPVATPLRLGELGGNRFRIRLRGVQGSAEEISAALEALRRHGFINYFGLQRFGENATRNDEVGRRLLLGEYA